MRFQYVPTMEDLTELLTVNTSKKRKWVRPGIFSAVILLLVAGEFTFYAASNYFVTPGAATVRQNLWVCLVPMLFAATLIVGNMIVYSGEKQPRTAGMATGAVKRLKMSYRVVTFSALAWFVLPNVPAAAVWWKPTPGQEMSAATVVWICAYALIQYRAAGGPRRAARFNFATKDSYRLPRTIEIDEAGVKTEYADRECRYQWSYFKRAVETSSLLILMTVDETPLYFAKRSLNDDAAVLAVKSTMQSHVAEVEFFETPAAFAVVMAG